MTARDIIAGAVPPEVIAAAWAAWRVRHKDQLGPGPAFVEAITAAIEAYRAAGYRFLAPGEGETEYEIWQDDAPQATSTSLPDALHYAAVYSQDGPVQIKEVLRLDIGPERIRALRESGG